MEKIKNFVVKYQLWFKIGTGVLLILLLVTPFWTDGIADGVSLNLFSFISYTANFPSVSSLSPLCIVTIILIFFALILTILAIFLKKTSINLCTILCIILASTFLIIVTSCRIGEFSSYGMSSQPHIAFYFAVLLFVLDLFALYFFIKHQKENQLSSKSDRITELEKKVAELENKTADPEQRELHPKDKDGE